MTQTKQLSFGRILIMISLVIMFSGVLLISSKDVKEMGITEISGAGLYSTDATIEIGDTTYDLWIGDDGEFYVVEPEGENLAVYNVDGERTGFVYTDSDTGETTYSEGGTPRTGWGDSSGRNVRGRIS